jgi:hypothetical protein
VGTEFIHAFIECGGVSWERAVVKELSAEEVRLELSCCECVAQ